jgi:hypothetical protein
VKRDFFAGVVALREENPTRFVNVIRNGWPEIKAAIDQGHTLKVIHQRLVKNGVRINYRWFTRCVQQLLGKPRKGRDESPEIAPQITARGRGEKGDDSTPATPLQTTRHGTETASAVESQETPDAHPDDPWANIRHRLHDNRPGFQWDEDVPDTNKLY